MSRELDLQAMRLLIQIDNLGSLGAAGRQLGISQPAASACLRAFEARWSLQLATRTARGTQLTQDGETVSRWARDLLHEVDTLRVGLTALSASHKMEGLELVVAASLTVAEFVLPRWIGELRALRPDVHVRLQVANSDAVDRLVQAGECDIGFVESSVVPSDLSRSVIGADRLTVVVHPGHPWARRATPVTHDQLLEAEFVVREEGSGTRATFERALAARPLVAMVATSTTALVGAAVAGVGPAVVTPYAVRVSIETGDLVEVLHELDLERPLTAIWRPDRPLLDAAHSLLTIARRASARLA
jgi:DNA-binding transcriptional LysR family regulator